MGVVPKLNVERGNSGMKCLVLQRTSLLGARRALLVTFSIRGETKILTFAEKMGSISEIAFYFGQNQSDALKPIYCHIPTNENKTKANPNQ